MEITKNKLARELLSLRTEENNRLIEDLRSMTPYQVKVFSCIYQTCNYALKSRMTGRFNSASSVIQLVRQDKDLALLYEETRNQDIYYINFFINSGGTNKFLGYIKSINVLLRP